MVKTVQLFVIAVVITMIPAASHGELILDYTGSRFTTTEGDFTEEDRITGRVTFDGVGDEEPNYLSLSTTVGGDPGFTFLVPDVTSPPSGIEVGSNTVTWGDTLPIKWNLVISGDLNGEEGDEVLAVQFDLGDQATINLGGDVSNGFAPTAEDPWTVVPEPSSLALATMAAGLGLFGFWRKRRRIRECSC